MYLCDVSHTQKKKKSLDYFSDFNFTTKLKKFGKICVVDAGYL